MPVFSGVYRAVAQSDLIALLPSQLARHAAREDAIEVYLPPMQIAAATIVMIWHRRNAASPPHLWFRTLLAEMLSPLDEAG